MGRPNKPTALKKLNGTYRSDRSNSEEPEFKILNNLDAPEGLFPAGIDFWNETIKPLVDSKVITEVDRYSYLLLAQFWGERWYLWYDVILKDENGNQRTQLDYMKERKFNKKNMPEISRITELDRMFVSLSSQFGMTPSSRAKLNVVKKTSSPEEDEMRALLSS